ncbi:YbgA family protein [Fervidobacterium thailandense]|uniref:DUF1722 domain-containing protein n=1 Tax=Fervidobacterium thailandense TaxID=1008305 RepID=A0A1E3G1N3_9BACT|nr:DUF523 and DUF1722 domain-containing protein [Fervidobacterium thailandense]ODN30092.1 hypothetical protein A4H02_07250 [Fervidobacterium thailandense]
MKRDFAKPRLVVSRCFFEHTRYDGGIISDDLLKKLEKYVDFIKVCPEVEIGLPTPREPIDVFLIDGEIRLLNKTLSVDLTDRMLEFSRKFAQTISTLGVDGMILKSKSPSCGLNDAKLYGPNGKVVSKTPGLFAKTMLEMLIGIPIESEMRLTNDKLRFEFLSTVFTLAKFRNVNNKQELIEFHASNKLFFMAKNEALMRQMGKIVARKGFKEIKEEYETILRKLLKTHVKKPRMINALMHMYGYFKEKVSSDEKAYFMDLLTGYSTNTVSLQSILTLLKSWALRFEEEYLLKQTIFEPYPMDLEAERESREYK